MGPEGKEKEVFLYTHNLSANGQQPMDDAQARLNLSSEMCVSLSQDKEIKISSCNAGTNNSKRGSQGLWQTSECKLWPLRPGGKVSLV